MPKIRAKQAFGLKLFETNEKFLIPKPALAVINRLQAEYQKLCHRFRFNLKPSFVVLPVMKKGGNPMDTDLTVIQWYVNISVLSNVFSVTFSGFP
jgi:hypothetical protein